MKRREFITLVGGAAAAWPMGAGAQQTPVIGLLGGEIDPHVAAFSKGLADAGYVEGRDVSVEYRWSEGHLDRYPALAADLVWRRVAAIAAVGGIPAAAAAPVRRDKLAGLEDRRQRTTFMRP
jgi:hypothetical protein